MAAMFIGSAEARVLIPGAASVQPCGTDMLPTRAARPMDPDTGAAPKLAELRCAGAPPVSGAKAPLTGFARAESGETLPVLGVGVHLAERQERATGYGSQPLERIGLRDGCRENGVPVDQVGRERRRHRRNGDQIRDGKPPKNDDASVGNDVIFVARVCNHVGIDSISATSWLTAPRHSGWR